MKDYHYVWLKAHPARSEDWLQNKLADGFDVHHLDGVKTNNDPGNLVLIDHLDHMKLHRSGGFNRMAKLTNIKGQWVEYDPVQALKDKVSAGKIAYEFRNTGLLWREVGDKIERNAQQAINLAKKYAEYHNRAWPVSIK